MNKYTGIIQARNNSSRLKRKMCKLIGKNTTLLDMVVKRIKQSLYLDNIIVATSTNEEDDEIQSICEKNNVNIYRGSEHDVQSRYLECSKLYQVENIVRLTGDCPFIDPRLIYTLHT